MRKIFVILIIILVCLMLIIQGLLAIILKGLVIKELNKIIEAKVKIDDLGINLVTGGVSFSGLKIQNPIGFSEKTFLTIQKGYVDINLLALLSKKIEIEKIYLNKPRINIEINNSSISNTSLILKKGSLREKQPRHTASNQKAGPALKINKINIDGGIFKLVNYKPNSQGATALFDKINISINDLVFAENHNNMPTLIECSARLPDKNLMGDIEFTARGSFLLEQINFDMDLKANKISLPYFMPFYINNAPIFAKAGWFNLTSKARCRDNQLNASQHVDIKNLELAVNSEILQKGGVDNLVFGLPAFNVANYFINSRGELDFDFEITGTLSDPKFHITEALQKVLVKAIGETISKKLSELPGTILEKIKQGGNVEDAGKELLQGVLQEILGAKKEEQK